MNDDTRKLLKVFGVAVTDAEAEAERLAGTAAQLTASASKCEPTTDRSGGNGVSPTPHHYAERLWAPTAAAPPGVGYSFNN